MNKKQLAQYVEKKVNERVAERLSKRVWGKWWTYAVFALVFSVIGHLAGKESAKRQLSAATKEPLKPTEKLSAKPKAPEPTNLKSVKKDKQQIIDLLKSSVELNNLKDLPKESDSIVPQSFAHHFEFSVPEISPKGGHAFICDKKKYCDPIYQYYDALKALAGPYVYQSKSGNVVMQLNSGLSTKTAEKLEKVMEKL